MLLQVACPYLGYLLEMQFHIDYLYSIYEHFKVLRSFPEKGVTVRSLGTLYVYFEHTVSP